MTNIMKMLLEISLLSSFMIVTIIAIKFFFASIINKTILAFMWLLILTRLVIPITFDVPVHLDSIFTASQTAENSVTSDLDYTTNNSIEYEINNTIDNADMAMEEIEPSINNRINNAISDGKSFLQSYDISLISIVLTIWLLGSIMFLTKNLWEYTRFIQTIRKGKDIKNTSFTELVIECKEMLRIKTDITVKVSKYVGTPITYGLFNPIIVLPFSYANRFSRKKLQMIVLHELSHIKRCDAYKNVIWLVAKSIHWFNPLVWIAYRSYLDDVELACDEMVMKKISYDDSLEYTQSLIDTIRFANKTKAVPPALSFCNDKSKIRRRIENMLKPQKNNKSVGFLAVTICLLMIVTCFTTACQPTPENTIIQNKSNTEMDEIIENSNPDNTQEAAQPQTETYKNKIQLLDGKLNINIDATVYTQNNNWSIVQASTNSLSNDDVRKMSSIIMNNQVLYNYTNEKTKQQLTDRLISYKSKWASGDRVISEEEYNQICADKEADIERAPETINYTFANYDTPTVYPDISGITVEMFYFMNDPINSEFEESLKFQSMEQGYEIFYQKILHEQDEYIETSQEQLISIAQSYLNELGIYNMTVVKIEESNPKYLTQEDVEFIGEENLTDKILYRLYLTREIGGNTVTYDLKDYANNNIGGPRPAGTDIPAYAPCPQGESVFMVITNNEVTNFKYTTPMTEHSVLSDNVAIKSIEEIMPIFTQYMEFNNVWTISSGQSTVVDLSSMNILNSDMEVEKIEFNIDTIKLGYMRVKDKNSNINSYLFIPVWDFYGTTIIYYSDGTSSQFDRPQTSYLTINAIDGTVINRYIGY